MSCTAVYLTDFIVWSQFCVKNIQMYMKKQDRNQNFRDGYFWMVRL